MSEALLTTRAQKILISIHNPPLAAARSLTLASSPNLLYNINPGNTLDQWNWEPWPINRWAMTTLI